MSYSGSDKRLAYLFDKQYDLADLGDTDIDNLTDGQILRYNGSDWENAWQEDYLDTAHQVGIILLGGSSYKVYEKTVVQNNGSSFNLGNPNYKYWIVEGFVTESSGLVLPLNYYQDSTHYVRSYVDDSGSSAYIYINATGFTLSGYTMVRYRYAVPLS